MIKENLNKCVGCNKCVKKCPMLKEFNIRPKQFLNDVSKGTEVDINMAYSCNLCDSCKIECPVDISYKDVFVTVREKAIRTNKKQVKAMGGRTVEFHQKNSFSKLFTESTCSSNTNELKDKIIFFPGCSLSSYSPELVERVFEYLKGRFNNIEMFLKCCGKPTLSIGDVQKFNEYNNILTDDLNKMGAKKVITACPNCLNTMRNKNSELEVISLWEVIAEKGIPKEKINIFKEVDMEFALHDPCSIREQHEMHKAVRKILGDLGVKIIEFERNRDKTDCCGTGGMVGCFNREMTLTLMKNRAEQTKEKNVVSYCQACVESLSSQGKNGVHILDLIFNDEMKNKLQFSQKKQSTIGKWVNRYKSKRKVIKYKEGKK